MIRYRGQTLISPGPYNTLQEQQSKVQINLMVSQLHQSMYKSKIIMLIIVQYQAPCCNTKVFSSSLLDSFPHLFTTCAHKAWAVYNKSIFNIFPKTVYLPPFMLGEDLKKFGGEMYSIIYHNNVIFKIFNV